MEVRGVYTTLARTPELVGRDAHYSKGGSADHDWRGCAGPSMEGSNSGMHVWQCMWPKLDSEGALGDCFSVLQVLEVRNVLLGMTGAGSGLGENPASSPPYFPCKQIIK